VVEVDLHLVIADGEDEAQKTVSVLVLKREDCTYLYVLSVKLTIDGEDLLVQLDDTLLDVLTVSLVWSQLEVELVTLVEVDYLSLERREGSSHATDEDERTIFLCLLNQLLVTIVTFCSVIQRV